MAYHSTYEEIMKDCIAQALLLPKDNIQTEIRDVALGAMNEIAAIIWQSWPWDAEKLDEFTAPTINATTGIITFASNVESIRAVKLVSTTADSDTPVWNEDELLAAAQGLTVNSERFSHLAPDSTGCRRIRLEIPDDPANLPGYKVLALLKYALAEVSASYDSTNPSATPLDYRVLTFVIDRAEPALRAGVKDSLRHAFGRQKENNFGVLLELALKRETYDTDRERRVEPRNPVFEEVGDW